MLGRNTKICAHRAARIGARAIRRAGELLKQIEPQRGANQSIQVGDRPNVVTRTDAARSAGMSPHTAKQAVRVASIPGPDFDRQVESALANAADRAIH